MKVLIEHLAKAFNLTEDLVEILSTEAFELKLRDLPSNTIGEQFWCIVGARESYLMAIINQEWSGFRCSLDNPKSKEKILKSVQKSAKEFLHYLNNHSLTEIQIELLVTLLEHEIQHHGQLIRYMYGNKLTFPKSWNERYTV